MATSTSPAPLENCRIEGISQHWVQAAPDAPKQPGGECWHCGQAIAYEVLVVDRVTGQRHTIGTTCAERVGLDAAKIKAMLAELYATERELARVQRSAAYRQQMADAEAARTAEFGPHGTEGRFWSGCSCKDCHLAAPHGTWQRFAFGKCRCDECIVAEMNASPGEYEVREEMVLVSLRTGEVVRAKVVETRYGSRWCVDGGSVWLGWHPVRRSTMARKGYVEASATVFGRRHKGRTWRDSWFETMALLATPVSDRWGEPIPAAA